MTNKGRHVTAVDEMHDRHDHFLMKDLELRGYKLSREREASSPKAPHGVQWGNEASYNKPLRAPPPSVVFE